MKRNKPLVSVIMPLKNADKYITAALKSILVDNDIPLEVVVIDDASSDSSVGCVMNCLDERIRLLKNVGSGVVAAKNTGFRAARGAILMCCDADDLYPEGRIRKQIEWLDRNAEFDAVCGAFSAIDHAGRLITGLACGNSAAELTVELQSGKVRTHLCAYAIRASLFERVGEFRDFFESAEDIDFQLRSGEAGRVAYVPTNWYFYRIHNASVTHTQSNSQREFFEAMAYELQRQRRTSGFDELQMGRAPIAPTCERSPSLRSNTHIQGFLLGRAWNEHHEGQRLLALRTALHGLALDPTQPRVWRSILALLIKPIPDKRASEDNSSV